MSLEMPIMPLNSVLFPGMPMPLLILEERYREMIAHCQSEECPFGVALIREGREVEGPAVPYEVGTTAVIVRTTELDEGGLHVLTVGQRRFRLNTILQEEPYLVGEVDLLEDEQERAAPEELHQELRELFVEHLRLVLQLLGQPDGEVALPDTPSRLSYMVAAHLTAPLLVRQRLLEMDSLAQRLFHEKELLRKESSEYRLLLAARKKYDELAGADVEDDIFSLN